MSIRQWYYYQTQVNRTWATGDQAGAQDAWEKATKFALAATIAAGVAMVLIVLIRVLAAGLVAGNT